MAERYEYYKLTDRKRYGTIVRAFDGVRQYQYSPEKDAWLRSAVMLHYFAPYDDNPYYDLYEIITEGEAKAIIERKGGHFNAPEIG